MLILACIALLGLLLATRHQKGPLWALGLSWLVCTSPIALGIISYDYFSPDDFEYVAQLLGFLACYVLGVQLHLVGRSAYRTVVVHSQEFEMRAAYRWAQAAWVAGMAGTVCICIDFAFLKGAGLSDIAALRDAYVTMERAGTLARIGSVLTWGCLYCFVYALTFRDTLSRRAFLAFLLPVVGYFLVAVFSAGRQTAFQVMIFALLTVVCKQRDISRRKRPIRSRRRMALPVSIAVMMISYMGYIAEVRNDGAISDDKSEVLTSLFDYSLPSRLQDVLASTNSVVRTTIVEALVYFSSPIALFQQFLTIEPHSRSYGAMTIPFVMRQVEPMTGISVAKAMESKVDMMGRIGVIGVGWTTGLSHYILDFGRLWTCVLLFLLGYYSSFAWNRARRGTNFNESVISLILLASAVYMPLVPASSDTNLLLLWLYCICGVCVGRSRGYKARSSDTIANGPVVGVPSRE